MIEKGLEPSILILFLITKVYRLTSKSIIGFVEFPLMLKQ